MSVNPPDVPCSGFTAAAEAPLVALARTGDVPAFEELVRRRQSAIRNLLRRLSRDPALADDLAQQTFVQAWQRLHTLQSPLAFGGWLRRIAVNSWLQHVRRRDARFESYDDAVPDEPSQPEMVGERMDLDRSLAQLPSVVRLCIVLSHGEGMSHGEIAQVTGLPVGTVKSHISRGLVRLREMLDGYR